MKAFMFDVINERPQRTKVESSLNFIIIELSLYLSTSSRREREQLRR